MSHPIPTAAAPLFCRAYDLAALIGDCRSVALALPAIIPDGRAELTLEHLEHLSNLASAVGRLLRPAEDLAYALGSDLHDQHRQLTKGNGS